MMDRRQIAPGGEKTEQRKEKQKEEAGELVIEDNTIYEIDRECMDCLHKKRGL